jgi:3D (Asp-Asp-Asp) domain-containing protein
MKNLVRGGVLVLLLSMLVVVIYAQARKDKPLIIANDSQSKLENNIVDIALFDNNLITTGEVAPVIVDDEKLVKTTGSVKAAGAGASRGSFSATAYCLAGRTALGHGVRRGIIAADPRVLPMGSRVVINGGGYSGTYLVSDTGSRVKGKKIDIWMPSCSEARRFGRRSVQIYSAQ